MQEVQKIGKNDQTVTNTAEQSFCINEDTKEGILPFSIKEEIVDNGITSTAQALKTKLQGIAKVLENCQVNNKSAYTIDELQILDGPSLLKLFALKEPMKDGFIKFRCAILPGNCARCYEEANEKDSKELMVAHLLNHVESLACKAAKRPSVYKTKLFLPCQMHEMKTESDFNICNEKGFPSRQQDALPINNIASSENHSSLPDLSKEPENSIVKSRPNNSLLNKFNVKSHEKNVGFMKKRRINTRLEQKNILKKQKEELNQQKHKMLEHFNDQPKVIIHDIINSPSKVLAKKTRRSFHNVNMPTDEDDSSSQSGFSSSDDEERKEVKISSLKRKMQTWKTKSLSATLRNRRNIRLIPAKKIKFSKRNLSKCTPTLQQICVDHTTSNSISVNAKCEESNNDDRSETIIPSNDESLPELNTVISNTKRCIPSILRRSTAKPKLADSAAPSKQFQNDIVQTPVSTESATKVSSSSFTPSVSPTKSAPTVEHDHYSSSEDGDSGSDSSCWSDNEQESKLEKNKHKDSRKQNLTESVKKEEIEKQIIKSAIHAIVHDHCYTNLAGLDAKADDFIKLMTPSELAQAKHSLRSKPQQLPPPSTDLYVLKGPSSKRIEPSSDPKVKAKALRLIAQLRHTKPKEVMVCTESIVENGQSAYVVQDFFTCEICGKRFTAPNSLYGHYRGHAGIKPYKCNICGRTFTRSHSLTYHNMIHNNTARFVCSHCGRKFRHPTHYKEHLHRHTGEEPYVCTDCPKRFKTRNTYRRHMITKHKKKISPMGAFPTNVRFLKTIYSSTKHDKATS